MSDSVITQVQKDARPVKIGKKRSFWRLLCCCSPSQPPPSNLRRNTVSGDVLLPPPSPQNANKKTLVLDLDETLVHSSFQPIDNADFIVPVQIEDTLHQVYVLKRPGVDQFLKRMGMFYEIVVFTASLAKYADPVLDLLDEHKVVSWRLFREACSNHKGNYVKDMGKLGRELKKSIIIDNSPASYMFNPESALPVESWFDDENDNELLDLIPILEELAKADDVRVALQHVRHNS